MKIRTQSMISMWLFGIIFVVVTALLFVTNHQVDRINQHIDIADGIERCARELGFLSNDYLLYHEGPQRTRWERKFSSLSADLSKLRIDSQEEQALVENIKANQHRLKAVFADVISALENRPGTGDQETQMAFLQGFVEPDGGSKPGNDLRCFAVSTVVS